VTGRPDDAIAIAPVRVFRIMLGNAQVEGSSDIHDRKRATRVAASSRTEYGQIAAAHQVGCVFEFFNGVFPDNFAGRGIPQGHSGSFPCVAPAW
jgi:hypothetical protein